MKLTIEKSSQLAEVIFREYYRDLSAIGDEGLVNGFQLLLEKWKSEKEKNIINEILVAFVGRELNVLESIAEDHPDRHLSYYERFAMTITWYREEQCRTNENWFYKFAHTLKDALEYHPLETDVISDILYALTRYDLKRLLKEVGE